MNETCLDLAELNEKEEEVLYLIKFFPFTTILSWACVHKMFRTDKEIQIQNKGRTIAVLYIYISYLLPNN